MTAVLPPTEKEREQKEKEQEKEKLKGAELEAYEKKKVEEEESLNASVTYEVVRREGEKELERSPSALAWSGLAGGLAMGFSFVAEGLLRSHLPDAPWRPLITKLGYPVGFLMISLGSQHLFTENTLTPVVPYLVEKTRKKLTTLSTLWAVTFIANIVGALLFATAIALTGIFEPDVKQAFTDIARETLRPDFITILLRGILAGWLIASMVWMLPAAKSGQAAVIIIMTYLVGIGTFSHIIVGSHEVLYLVMSGQATIIDYLIGFMIPALLGNIIGGLALVAGLNHAQVASSGKKG
ncbi:MAG TPA: formate/nitrite transporter family protein [Gemmatimonadaceae bacterium]|nr:formate/nitrite transporter family protein [Gemmatimonadaceae bacterium]